MFLDSQKTEQYTDFGRQCESSKTLRHKLPRLKNPDCLVYLSSGLDPISLPLGPDLEL